MSVPRATGDEDEALTMILGGNRYGCENDVYGTCSCGETRRHGHTATCIDAPDDAPKVWRCNGCGGEGTGAWLDDHRNLPRHGEEGHVGGDPIAERLTAWLDEHDLSDIYLGLAVSGDERSATDEPGDE